MRINPWVGIGLLLVYAYFCWLMYKITVQYVPYATDIAFLRIKQAAASLAHYLPFFYLHVYSSFFVLLAGFTQFSGRIRQRMPRLHRMMGWTYMLLVLFAAGPSGLVLGYHANGGWSSQLAFCLLAIFWLFYTARAGWYARQQDWSAHRNDMIRSFALTLSAITLRAWKYILVALFTPRPMDVYRWVAWLGWLINLAIAEWLIYKITSKGKTL